MKKLFFLILVLWGCLSPVPNYGQEEPRIMVEESAEVFLEEYSDDFQESFFEGLKQKGIQNYDRAIAYFMECKRLQPDNKVVSFELAKSNLWEKELVLAQEYAVEAVKGNPENYWYAATLVEVVGARKSVLEDVTDAIPWDNSILKGNIADIYFKKGDYQIAKRIIASLSKEAKYIRLKNRIFDSIAKQERINNPTAPNNRVKENEELNNVEQYKVRINSFLNSDNEAQLAFQTSEEAMERFPSQPYFYYANGYALNRLQKHSDAVELLETALDFLVDDVPLENRIYEELVFAYMALDNETKATLYRSKIKPGF